MIKQIFAIIGTDTEIGKTYTCRQLLGYFSQRGKKVCGLKPVASGINLTDLGEINPDSYIHYQAGNCKLPIARITPFLFREAVAPHIAANKENHTLSSTILKRELIQSIAESDAEIILIEGVGGLMTPLNYQETYLDLLTKLQIPVILVIGLKLGCLNHALLTDILLKNNNLSPAGFITNLIDPQMKYPLENIQTLIKMLSCPLLATIGYQETINPLPIFEEIFHD